MTQVKHTIFYSWQSNIRAAACRTLIEEALNGAAAELHDGVVEPVVDRDTQGESGSPDIGQTIFKKIDSAAAFVADVTIVGKLNNRSTPNPNVLIELGYALKALGESRIIMVLNTAFGAPEELPFDLRQKRTLKYSSSADAIERAPQRRELQRHLKDALALVLENPRSQSGHVDLTVGFTKERIESAIHHYRFAARVKNVSRQRIDDWEIDVRFPSSLMERNIHVVAKVDSESNADFTLIRVVGRAINKPLRPGEEYTFGFGYFVDHDLYFRRAKGLDEPVKTRVLIDGRIDAEIEEPASKYQTF